MRSRNRQFVANIENVEVRCLPSSILSFTIKDLGLAANISQAGAINSSGQIASTTAFPYNSAIFDSSGITRIPNETGSRGVSINDFGVLLGNNDSFGGSFIYSTNSLIDLGKTIVGSDINNLGNVVGEIASGSLSDDRAFFYDGTIHDIGAGPYSMAHAINDSNQIVGVRGDPANPQAFFFSNGVIHDLGSFNGSFGHSDATDINSLGQVTGYATDNFNTNYAFISDANGGTIHKILPPPGASWDEGASINDQGHVVGLAQGSYGSFYYDGKDTRWLNDLIPQDSGFRITNAFAINNKDQIASLAFDQVGQIHMLLLTPAPSIVPPTISVSSHIIWIDNTANLGGNTTTISFDSTGTNILVATGDTIQIIPKANVFSLCYKSSQQGHDILYNTTGLNLAIYGYGDNNEFHPGSSRNVLLLYGNDDTVWGDPGSTNVIIRYGGLVKTLGSGTFQVWG